MMAFLIQLLYEQYLRRAYVVVSVIYGRHPLPLATRRKCRDWPVLKGLAMVSVSDSRLPWTLSTSVVMFGSPVIWAMPDAGNPGRLRDGLEGRARRGSERT